jgi:hypothetical protein
MYASGNVLVHGCTTTQEFLGLSVVYNSLSGPFSLLRSPDLTLIKASWIGFPTGVFPGVYTKILVFICA